MIIKTKAIVIRTVDFQESSKIVTVLTEQHGKVALIAKGARSQKSKYGHLLQVMNELEILYYFKPGRDVQNLSQAENLVKRNFLFTDYDIMMSGFRILEWMNKLHLPDHESDTIFHLLSKVLETLDKTPTINEGLYPKFLIRITQIMGYEPNYTECAGCEKQSHEFGENEELGISVKSGQLYCNDCLRNFKIDYHVTTPVINMMNKWLFPNQFPPAKNGTNETLIYQNIQQILESHLNYHLELKH